MPDGMNDVTYVDPVESSEVEFPGIVPIWVDGELLRTRTLNQQQVVPTVAHRTYSEVGPIQISVGVKTLDSGSFFFDRYKRCRVM